MQIILAIFLFIQILGYLIILDIILSWLILFGLNFRPKIISDIIDPIYFKIRKIIPTSIGIVDFTPIVVILILFFIKGILIIIFPELTGEANNLLR